MAEAFPGRIGGHTAVRTPILLNRPQDLEHTVRERDEPGDRGMESKREREREREDGKEERKGQKERERVCGWGREKSERERVLSEI